MELFLRGNWEILEELRAEWHVEKLAGKHARVAELQRGRLQARAAAATVAYKAAEEGAGRPAHADPRKRARDFGGGGGGSGAPLDKKAHVDDDAGTAGSRGTAGSGWAQAGPPARLHSNKLSNFRTGQALVGFTPTSIAHLRILMF